MRRLLPWLIAALLLAAPFGLAPRPAEAQTIVHIVQPGENLFRIGLRYGVPWSAIMSANGLSSITIYVGQRLTIPLSPAALPPAATAGAPAPTTAPPAAAAPAPGTYVVQAGDTAWRIASRYQITVTDLAVANGLYDPRFLYAGQSLVIPGGAGASAAPASAAKYLNVVGRGQSLPLNCEARSAVDWAAFFGVAIDELEFFWGLPASDDPEIGFVGDVYGAWGQVPPASYGVHAGPVAARLRAYGVRAQALRGMGQTNLQTEIDAGRPVIVWVIGHVWDGAGQTYVAPSTGNPVTVARYEHTVIVTGYTAETVTVLDGAFTTTHTWAQFLRSWGVLGNQAIVVGP